MKKKLLCFLAFLPVAGFSQVFTEDFDGNGPGIEAWTVIDVDGQTPAEDVSFITNGWNVIDREGDEGLFGGPPGNHAAMSTSWYDPAGVSNDWLISPSVTIPEGTHYLVWDAKAQDAGYRDGYELRISPNGGNTVEDFTEVVYSNDAEDPVWVTRSFDLTDYAGMTIRFAFVNNSDDKFMLLVDNVSIGTEQPATSYCGVVNPETFLGGGVEATSLFEFADISNPSAPDSTDEYEDFTDMIANVTPGQTYPVAFEGFTGGNFVNFFTVFVDWNQDGVFDDVDERHDIGSIENSTGSDGQQATGEILVPPTAAIGQTRLRVVKYYDEYTPTACLYEQGWYGQVEDYTLNVGDLSALNFDASRFRAYPNPVVDIIKVDYDKALSGVEVFNVMGQKVFTQQLSSNQAEVNLSTLTPGTYLMKVSAIDGSAKAIKVVKQ